MCVHLLGPVRPQGITAPGGEDAYLDAGDVTLEPETKVIGLDILPWPRAGVGGEQRRAGGGGSDQSLILRLLV